MADLEQIIHDHAQSMAADMLQIVAEARSEEDVRHGTNKLIDGFLQAAGIAITGKHEYGLAGGRVDSKYGGVIIEYKDPSGARRITEDPHALGTKAAIKQIRGRFRDFESHEGMAPDRLLGVGCDGDTLIFVRQRGNELVAETPVPVTPHTVERLLRALVSLGAQGMSFTPELLAGAFGFGSGLAEQGVRDLYDAIVETTDPKALVFFNQWKILFGEVCGYDIEGKNPKIGRLGEHYLGKPARPAEMLFSLHTYYAIFMKLLAAEIVSSFSPLGVSVVQGCCGAPSDEALLRETQKLEQCGIWSQLGITNFLEGDIFSWYLSAWDARAARTVRGIVEKLDQFDPTTLSVEPAESRDLLKQLYQELFPTEVRHDLGEYYTPDWLAEFVIEELGWDGDPDKRLLDPACGSGTFLVMAINKARAWFVEHRDSCGYREDGLLQRILQNIIGFDLNPLAVMAARTNYLLAVRDLLRWAPTVELPVYLCDSIMTPSEHRDLFTQGAKLNTAVGEFHIPQEIAESREQLGKYADALEFCVRNGYSPEDFIAYSGSQGLPTDMADAHRAVYGKLMQLDAGNQNGIWAHIIKNAFAPIFIARVDYVMGNPPWVNWTNLPPSYRQSTAALWQHYGLFPHSGYQAQLGGAQDDLSVLLTYVAHDVYLSDGGRLGFVITQTVFKTEGGGRGFRSLTYVVNGTNHYVTPIAIHDMDELKPFGAARGPQNQTAVAVFGKSRSPFSYPVPYTQWRKLKRGGLSQELSLEEVRARTECAVLLGEPVDPDDLTSPWIAAPRSCRTALGKLRGSSTYTPRKGVYCASNAIYWLSDVFEVGRDNALVTNVARTTHRQVEQVTMGVDPRFVFPLLRGKDTARWSSRTEMSMILPYDPEQPKRAVTEAVMKRDYPRTFAYFRRFEEDIRGCALLGQYYDPNKDPFYSCYNIGSYTFSPYRVCWKEISAETSAVVVSRGDPCLVPDHKLVMVAFEEEAPAHFLCGMLNSAPVRLFVRCYTVKTSISGHVCKYVAIPSYDPNDPSHQRLAGLSQHCHAAAAEGDADRVAELEKEVDGEAAALWGITENELNAIQDALRDT